MLVLKTDKDGNFLWSKTLESDFTVAGEEMQC
jgi:hypothetical protein